ncbi:HlyD family efflux transporter periplasmic adaptor subunit [Polaromonas sp.]|uniref:efflux RND transporter periplasmic adaptor subunit n=1 Tax=Polaromonas sp. TaxID=1869339 RepID=UPI00286A6C1C|nr:HlyD family efflux transporter periplasmic adaptor subunit [Polaromonas sp.]
MSNHLETAGTAALAALLHLEQRALAAATPAALGFTVVNETLTLVHYRQAAFFTCPANGKLKLATASGLVSVAEDSPYAVWLGRFAQSFPALPGCEKYDFGQAAPDFVDGWEEWLPEHLLVATLFDPSGQPVGLVLYARETPWHDTEIALLDRAHQSYGYCLDALSRGPRRLGAALGSVFQGRFAKWLAIGALLAMLIPVRLSALAPAEVIALTAMAVASPQDGVISAFHVQPNATVKAGDKLFSLDDSALASRREVALRGVTIARADLLVAEQRAFDDLKSKGELAAAAGRVREKEAELALVETTLDRVAVKAERDGIAVFGDPNDWLGRPVQTGERVMQLADPRDAGVLVWLPVADALNLEPGAPIRLFLHTKPLSPLPATLLQTSYQAVQSPDGVSAYRLRGQFEAGADKARIGLRGTARVSGDWAVLGYYLFRRPIAAVREWTGL